MTRATLLKLHRWVGLGLGLLLLIQALTGTALVYREEIERIIHPALVTTPTATATSIQPIIDLARAMRPGADLNRVEFPGAADEALRVLMRDRENQGPWIIAVDPGTGDVVRQGGLLAWPMELTFHIHEELVAGDFGNWIVGIEGIALFFMAITGPFIWWPGRRRLRVGFRVVVKSGSDLAIRTLHRAGGAVLAVLLIVSSATGALMVFKGDIPPALKLVTDFVPKPSPKIEPQPGAATVPVDTLIATAQASDGATRLRELRFSGKAGQVVAVFLQDAASLRSNASRQIYFNVYSGREVARYIPSELPGGNSFIDWLFTIHTGHALGFAGRLLVLISGLGLLFFAGSGYWLWLSRRRQKRTRKAERVARTQPAKVTG